MVGGSLQGTLSETTWTTWSAGQSDPFQVNRAAGGLYRLPNATALTPMILSDLSDEPILFESDGSATGLTWGDALVRFVSPTVGVVGDPGFVPPAFGDLDLLVVSEIPEPTTWFLMLTAFGGTWLVIRTRSIDRE